MPQGYDGLPSFYVQSANPITANLGLSLKGMDPIVAENFVLVDNFAGNPSSTVSVNGSVVSNPNFKNSATVTFSVSGSDITATSAGGGSGTVTSFSSGNLSPLFTTAVATATTTPALSFSLSTQNNNVVLAGPTSGGPLAPTFRLLVAGDIPALPYLPSSTQLPQTIASSASKWLNSYTASTGLFTATQPAFTDISGSIALSQTVLTTLGDIEYVNSTPALARLAGNTTATKMYLSQTGNGSISAAPAWAQINYADITGTTPTPPSGAVLWSALGNASGNLTLSNGAFTTTFDQTTNANWTWANTTAATGSNTTAFSSDGSSLTGWTNSGVTIDNVVGNPAPSFKVAQGTSCHISAGIAVGATVQFDFYFYNATTALFDMYFGCNSSGSGPAMRIDSRTANVSGFFSASTFTSVSSPTSGAGGGTISTLAWHTIKIVISADGFYATWFLDGVAQGIGNFPNGVLGAYLGFYGDGGANGANIDNMSVVTTASTNQPAPVFKFVGQYWDAATSSSLTDTWTFQATLSGGIGDPPAVFSCQHTGSDSEEAAFSLDNAVMATSVVSQNSIALHFGGQYWNGAASAQDNWSIQNIIGAGTNGTSTLTFAHSGSSGAIAVQLTGLSSPAYTPNLLGPIGVGYGISVGINTSYPVVFSSTGNFDARFAIGTSVIGAITSTSANLFSVTCSSISGTINLGQNGGNGNRTSTQPMVCIGDSGDNFTATSGAQQAFTVGIGLTNGSQNFGLLKFAPTSGTATYAAVTLGSTINQTGGANGSYTILKLQAIETAVGGSSNKLIDCYAGTTGATEIFSLDNTGVVNAAVGYEIGGAATSGNYLRGNGTNFISSAIQIGDIPSLSSSSAPFTWTDYTPTVTAFTGAFSSVSATGRYMQMGKMVHFTVVITVGASGIGTAATATIFTLPVAAVSTTTSKFNVSGREVSQVGTGVIGEVDPAVSTTTATIKKYDNSFGMGNSYVVIASGFYETA